MSFADPYRFETQYPGRFKHIRYDNCFIHPRYKDRWIAVMYLSKERWQKLRNKNKNEYCVLVAADTLESPVITLKTFRGGGDLEVTHIEALHYGGRVSTDPVFSNIEQLNVTPDIGNKNQLHILPMSGLWEIDYYAVRIRLNGKPADSYVGLHTIKYTEEVALAVASTAATYWMGTYVKEAFGIDSDGGTADLLAENFMNATGAFIMDYVLNRNLERASKNAIVTGVSGYIGERVGIPATLNTFASTIITSVTWKAYDLWDLPEKAWKVR